MSRFLGLDVLVIALGIGAVWYNYGTLNACSIVRIRVREQDHSKGVGIAAIMPDAFLNGALEAKYGPLSPSRCVKIILQKEPIL